MEEVLTERTEITEGKKKRRRVHAEDAEGRECGIEELYGGVGRHKKLWLILNDISIILKFKNKGIFLEKIIFASLHFIGFCRLWTAKVRSGNWEFTLHKIWYASKPG